MTTEPKFEEGQATIRVWENGDYEIRAFNAEVAQGNILEERESDWAPNQKANKIYKEQFEDEGDA